MLVRWFSSLSATRRYTMLLVTLSLLLMLIVLSWMVSLAPLLVVGLVLVCVLSVLAFIRPPLALLFVFTGAGLPSVLWVLPGHMMRLVEPALLLCIVLIVLRRPALYLRLPHVLAVLFLVIAFISFIHVPDISTDVNAFAADKRLYELVLTCVAFFCGTFLMRYVKNASSFLVAVLLCHVPFYLIGLAQAVGIPLPTFLEASGAQDLLRLQGRLWGPTSGAATLGLYLVNLLAVALACCILGIRRRDRIIGAIMTLATVLELVGSGTRSAALGAFCLLIVSLVLTRRFKLLLAILLGTGIAVVGLLGAVLPLFVHDPSSITNRLFLWQEAITLILTHPWIGIGLQQFHVYYAHLIVNPNTTLNAHGVSVHNQYLELALESGIAWLIVALLLLSSMLLICWHAYQRVRGERQVLLLAAILALIANMVTGLFDVPLDKAEGAIFLFLLAGMALGYAQLVPNKAPRKQRAAVRLPIAMPSFPRIPVSLDSAPSPQKAVRSITIQLLGWVLTGPIIFPVTALLTRYLGPVQYGEYNFTLPLLAIGALLSGTGMDPLIIRRLSRLPRAQWGHTLSYAAGLRMVSTMLSVGVIALLAIVLPISPEQRDLLLVGSVSLFFSFSVNGLRAIYSHGFRAEQRVTVLIVLEMANRLLTAVAVLLVVLLRFPLLWAYILIIYSDLPFGLVQILVARQRFGIRIRFHLDRIREYFVGSLALTSYDALSLINAQADIILLMFLTGPLNVGLYALGIRISDPLLAIAFAYVNGIYPLLCSTFERGREQFAHVYQEATRLLALLIVPLAILISMEAKTIVGLLGGQHFSAAASVVQLLIWATAAVFLSQLAIQSCMAANMERVIPRVAGVVACVNVLANLLLIPIWQVIGAGIAAVMSELTALLLFTLLLRRHIRLLPTVGAVLQVLLGNVPALVFLFWQQRTSPLLTIPIALTLMVLGCLATRALLLRDIATAYRFLYVRRSKQSQGEVPSVSILASFRDVAECPTLILPQVRATTGHSGPGVPISECPTFILPRIRV